MQKRQDKAEKKKLRAQEKANQSSGPEFGSNDPFHSDPQDDHQDPASNAGHVPSAGESV